MSHLLVAIHNPGIIAPARALEQRNQEGELETRTSDVARSAMFNRTEAAAAPIPEGKAEPLHKPETHTAVHETSRGPLEVPGPVKGFCAAITQPACTGHIDEIIFAKQTEKGKPQRTFLEQVKADPFFPFRHGKYILNVTKSLGKYGVLFTIIDGVKPFIQKALPDNAPCKEAAAMVITSAIAGVAETLATAPLSVCGAAKKTDANQGKPVRTCREIIRGVEPGKRLSHFWPKEVIKWNGARNVLFAVPMFALLDPVKTGIESAFGYSKEERPSRAAQIGIDIAGTGISSSVASAFSFWADTIATRCTQTPGLNGIEEIKKILKKEGLPGTVIQLNQGLTKVFIRMGLAGAALGGVTAGLGIAYEPTQEAFRQGLEGARISLAAFNPGTDLIADSPAEARRLGGGQREEERPSTSIADFVAESPSEALALGGQPTPAASSAVADEPVVSSGKSWIDYTSGASFL